MTSFVEFLAPVVLAATLTPRGDTVGPSGPPVVARVATSIAGTWNVPAETVRLAWGRLPAGGLPEDEAAFRLVGGGNDGWFAVVFHPGDPSAGAVRVRAGTVDTAWVAVRALATGHRIEDGDVRPEPVVSWGPPAPRGAARRGPGWELRRPLAAGERVEWPAIAPPTVVAAGDHLEIAWRRGGASVRLDGVALHAARLGEPVRVRVDGRPRPLTAIVESAGHAALAAPEPAARRRAS